MSLNYSKWDALELSDDSDIEVHPNVDKKSFIRVKQAQIHQERAQRRQQISTMKHERVLNAGMLARTRALVGALEAGQAAAGRPTREVKLGPAEVAFRFVTSLVADAGSDKTPEPPEGIYKAGQNPPSYGALIGTLFDQAKAAVEKKDVPADRLWQAYIDETGEHVKKIEELQAELEENLAKLEKEEAGRITSDHMHEGFNVTHVAKKDEPAAKTTTKKETTVELLNPAASASASGEVSKPAGDGDDDGELSDGDIESATPLGKAFLKISESDLLTCRDFLVANRDMLSQRETDALLVEAFNSQIEGDEKFAKRCVHHALLAQYCRQLGHDGVRIFFARITDKTHKAAQLFYPDVESTYGIIKKRAAVLAADRAAHAEQTAAAGGGPIEQIQLQPVTPGSSINITIPPPEDAAGRAIFEALSTPMRKAIETGRLDEINRVLGRMPVDEAEAVVAQLGEGGIIGVEEEVIDATTEEGQEVLKMLESRAEQEREESAAAGAV